MQDADREPVQRPAEPYWTAGRVASTVIIALALIGLGLLLIRMASFIMLVFSAVVLAVVFDAITRAICKVVPIGRGIALPFAAIALIGVFVGAFVLFGSQLTNEFDTIKDSLPGAVDRVESLLESLGLGDAVREGIDQAKHSVSTILGSAGGYMLSFGSSLTNLVLVIAGALFLAGSPQSYRRGFLLLIPQNAEETANKALDDAWFGLNGWMRGQVLSSVVVAVLTSAGLALLGVPSAAGLGLIAGLLDVVPMIGPVIAGAPAVLLAFTVSPMTALWTLVLYLVVQQLQGNVLQPMIQQQAVNIPPAILLFSVVAAGMLFGMLGVLLASPLTITLFVVVQRVYVRTLLGKPIRIGNRED